MNLHAITVVLLLAKLCGIFPYSWWWALAPSILAIGIALLLVFLVLVLAAFAIFTDRSN